MNETPNFPTTTVRADEIGPGTIVVTPSNEPLAVLAIDLMLMPENPRYSKRDAGIRRLVFANGGQVFLHDQTVRVITSTHGRA